MPNFSIEKKYNQNVVGLDEVGRGPLAGPVVSCAFIFIDKSMNANSLDFIKDSKKLSKKKRSEAIKLFFELRRQNKIKYSLGMATVTEIDNLNILEATKLSMIRATSKINLDNAQLIVDGNIDLNLTNFPCESFIKGDEKSLSIAAASIIAKIHRDRYMHFLSKKFPVYEWHKNVGYGTKKHIQKIKENGITIHHRKTFEPIKSLIHKNDSHC